VEIGMIDMSEEMSQEMTEILPRKGFALRGE